jgi:hypothetical protein
MKKAMNIMLCLVLATTLSGCWKKKTNDHNNNSPKNAIDVPDMDHNSSDGEKKTASEMNTRSFAENSIASFDKSAAKEEGESTKEMGSETLKDKEREIEKEIKALDSEIKEIDSIMGKNSAELTSPQNLSMGHKKRGAKKVHKNNKSDNMNTLNDNKALTSMKLAKIMDEQLYT